MSTPAESQEIIIIKRGGDHDEGHHGGAWKIAFADFMTAMMALFLVLWLVNAANEETKKAVASYFNPVKLVDRNRSVKGLEEMTGGQTELEAQKVYEKVEADPEEAEAESETAKTVPTDAELFQDPYKVLAEIAAEGEKDNSADESAAVIVAGEPGPGAEKGQAFKDPFAPDFWKAEASKVEEQGEPGEQVGEPDRTKTAALPDGAGELVPDMPLPDEAAKSPEAESESGEADQTEPERSKEEEKAEETEASPVEAKDQLLEEIRQAFAEAFGKEDDILSGLSVSRVDEGIAISVTDQLDMSMFEVGSAVPKRDLVLAMEKIAGVLAEREGSIRIYGHTDARPFAGKQYGNWQLSAARAQSAYFMLVRAGLKDTRFSQIAGFADRNLRQPDDPTADANRRIEILLEVE